MGPDSNRQEDHRSDAGAPGKRVIVGIGASAGGVQALQAFFEALPDHVGAAFVVVVHLDPNIQSELASILAAKTRMPVAQVDEPADLEADHVYVIPPNRRLRITGERIAAAEFKEPRGQRAPIDLFFRSLAEQHDDGFAVILTGAGSDGTAGIKAVKEAGGIILVQDPGEAEYPSMPKSAIATGLADFVMPVSELAGCLVELVRHRKHGPAVSLQDIDEELFSRILANVRTRTGHDFSRYKRSTLLRRIARRVQVTKRSSLAEYYDLLRSDGEEAQLLLGDLLISVTTFFRDREAFDALAVQALPRLFDGKEAADSIRVWVPGCATGEEAYTLAILLIEEAARREVRPGIQIFASDLDSSALAVGREGRYAAAAVEADIGEDRLRHFFVHEGDYYRVRRELRDSVLFAAHSLLKDPPFSRLDLISCRNVLIYLDRELQEQVCTTFHYALNPAGFLFIGASESAEYPPGLFHPIDRAHRIYRSTADAAHKPRLVPRLLGPLGMHRSVPLGRPAPQALAPGEVMLHRRALEKIAPPSILVDEIHRAVHLSDSAGRYLKPAGGALTGDVVDLVRPELRFELRAALHHAFEGRQATLSMPILVRFNGAPRRVYLEVKPVSQDEGPPQHALVMFIEGEALTEAGAPPGETGDRRASTDETIRLLNEELQATQDRLRTMREESETANEELRTANEELQSVNEEYRSTSEELETSKEELQSINEELQTVNNELKLKFDAVSRAHGDLQNLMAATDFGTLFLDQSLRIKRFTAQLSDLFSIAAGDEGRPITDFTHQLEYDGLAEDARGVLRNLSPIEREVQSLAGRWYLMRMRPYRTVEDKIDGIVTTFLDITDRRRVEEALRTSEEQLRQKQQLIELSQEPIFIWDFDGGIIEWNRGSEQLYGYTRAEALGRSQDELLKPSIPGSSFAHLKQKLLDSGTWSGELTHRTKDGRELTVESRIELRPLAGRRLVLETTRDITERKQWERRQQMLLGELTHRVKNTLAIVQSIAHQTLNTSKSKEDFVKSFDGRLAALAGAHTLLVDSNWRGAELGALARHQLAPLMSGDIERLKIEGDPVILPADLATPFGLVLHELATNAIKHGSLSQSDGTVTLDWNLDSAAEPKMLTVVWREEGGPPVMKPNAPGFGTSLIERAIPNAKVRYEFRRDGIVCTITLPLPERIGGAARPNSLF